MHKEQCLLTKDIKVLSCNARQRAGSWSILRSLLFTVIDTKLLQSGSLHHVSTDVTTHVKICKVFVFVLEGVKY